MCWGKNREYFCRDGKCVGVGGLAQRHDGIGKREKRWSWLHMGLLIESNETQWDKDHQSLGTDDTFPPAHIPLSSSDTEGGMKEKSVLPCCLQKRQTHTHSYVEHHKCDDKLPRWGTVTVPQPRLDGTVPRLSKMLGGFHSSHTMITYIGVWALKRTTERRRKILRGRKKDSPTQSLKSTSFSGQICLCAEVKWRGECYSQRELDATISWCAGSFHLHWDFVLHLILTQWCQAQNTILNSLTETSIQRFE